MRHQKIALTFVVAAIGFTTAQPLWAASYRIDPARTVVSFDIRNFAANVHGTFREFDGTVDFDAEKPEKSSAEGTIRVDSIDTKNAERDKHLLTKDFFDAGRFPSISFKNTGGAEVQNSKRLRLKGILTIHGVEKAVVLDIRDLTTAQNPEGTKNLTFTATTRINRRDFGIAYGGGIGQVALGDTVGIRIEAQASEVKNS